MPVRNRATKQRAALTRALAEQDGFRSAQDIHRTLLEGGDSVGLATVYRNLALMAELDEIDMILREDGEALYRSCRDSSHHHHLVCRECGKAVEVTAPPMESWAEQVAAEQGFSDVTHLVELFGRCRDCSDS